MAQNSGVRCDTLDSETCEETTYFGFVEDIWELGYGTFQIPVFWCQWVEDKHVTVDNYGVRVLDLSKVGYKDDPWIIANRAAQSSMLSRSSLLMIRRKLWTIQST